MQAKVTDTSHRLKLMMLTVGFEVGGTEQQLLDLSSRLDRRRFDVTVCALKGDGRLGDELRERGVRAITLNGKSKWDVRVVIRLWRMLRREKPDILHAFLLMPNVVCRVMGRLLKVPVVVGSYRGVEIWASEAYVVLDRITACWVDAMTCCSHAVRQSVVSRIDGAQEKYVAIHNGIDIARFSTGAALTRSEVGALADGPIIGTVCRLDEPVKGLRHLLHAFAVLLQDPKLQDCQLLVVGDGPARAMLETLAMTLGISKHVVFLGMRRDVQKILPLMDLFVLPSQYEGFGIAIVEAMAAGRPIVATAVGGIPEIVLHGETGLLVAPSDLVGLVEAMSHVLHHPECAARFGSAGMERARKHFSIEKAVKRHELLYETLWGAASRDSLDRQTEMSSHEKIAVTH